MKSVLSNEDLDLETPCWNCSGGIRKGETCEICSGTGYQTTEFGEKLILFLKRHKDRL